MVDIQLLWNYAEKITFVFGTKMFGIEIVNSMIRYKKTFK